MAVLTFEDMIVLRSDRLRVDIARPGRAYRGTRFDWTSFITQVTLDANESAPPGRGGPFSRGHTFCVEESFVPGRGTGGIGLCNEFGIETPIGYDDAQPGETFPKLGIGLLVRPDGAPYNFFRPYEVAQLFPTQIKASESQVTFTVEPLDCRGYAARVVKTVSVEANTLSIAYTVENVGEKPIVTREYCHNFMGINGAPMGPNYVLRVPYEIDLEPMPEQAERMLEDLEIEESTLRVRKTPQHPFYCRLQGFSRTDAPQWELVHTPSGLTTREYDDFAPVRVAVWGESHVISAEVFVDIDIRPSEVQHWTRRYEFLGM